ncbi:hypothetical protein [Microbaculum marinum]|uniref:Uncharacterized protein n=1 Tax=Microbaculum marinum TaxID=1764581 RepID=A0AAW9RNC4_9HYPH
MARPACLLAVLTLLLPAAAAAQTPPGDTGDDAGYWEDITTIQCWLPDATDGTALVLDMTSSTRRPRQLFKPDDPDVVERPVFIYDDANLGITTELRVYSISVGRGNSIDIVCTVGLPR